MGRTGVQGEATVGRILEKFYALRAPVRTRVPRSRQLPTDLSHAVGCLHPVTRAYQGDQPSTIRLHPATRPAHARPPTTALAQNNLEEQDLKTQEWGLTGPPILELPDVLGSSRSKDSYSIYGPSIVDLEINANRIINHVRLSVERYSLHRRFAVCSHYVYVSALKTDALLSPPGYEPPFPNDEPSNFTGFICAHTEIERPPNIKEGLPSTIKKRNVRKVRRPVQLLQIIQRHLQSPSPDANTWHDEFVVRSLG